MPGQQPRQSGLSLLMQPEVMATMAGQLLGNQGNQQNFGNALSLGGLAMGKQRELQAQTAEKNKTYQFFRAKAPEYADMIDAGMPVDKAWSEYNQRQSAQAGPKFGNSVVWGKNKDGKWVALQPSSDGGLTAAQTPDGIDLAPPGLSNLDLGTSYGLRDRAGDVVGNVPIDNAGAERDKVLGKDQGDAVALHESMSSKMPGLRHVADQLDTLAEEATYTFAGRTWDETRKQFGADPRAAAVARTQYEAIVDNQVLPLLRDTFGAQFTVTEGQSLRATLGDPNKSPSEKKAVLRAFIDQKERDIAALAQRTGHAAPAPAGGSRYRYNVQTGELE